MRSPREGALKGTPPSGFASFHAEPNNLLDAVLDILDDAKAEDIVNIDLPRPRTLSMRQTPAFARYSERISRVFQALGVLREQ